ncbi:MAG: ankyrin repeat domain-containing protein [Planctomycetota bacterium]
MGSATDSGVRQARRLAGAALAGVAALALWSLLGGRGVGADVGAGRGAATDAEARLRTLEARLAALEGRGVAAATPSQGAAADVPAVAVPEDLEDLERRLRALEQAGVARGGAEPTAATPPVGELVAALAAADAAAVARLLVPGVDVDARDEDRQTPLAAAAVSGRTELVELLLAHGARLERTAQRGMTPLLAALDAGQQDTALLLLERGASARAVDKNGEDALIWAAFNGCERVVERLLRRGDLDLDRAAHDGRTALHDAARRGHLEVVRRLLDAGAAPSVADRQGATPLALAVAAGHDAVAALLRRRGGR